MQRIYKLHACLQARNYEGRRGDQAFLEKFFPRQEKLFGHSLKKFGLSQKILGSHWCPKLVTGLLVWFETCPDQCT